MLKDRKQRKDIFIVLILFLFSILYHYFIGDFTKGLETYPDELRYFSIARSIARGEGFLIRGINYGYQKIMYSLFLSPIFWFKDPALIVKLINLLNSVAMASTVIPAYRIAKRIRANQLATYLFCFFVAIWSETIITMTFMAEVIYWPLCFWFIDLWLSIQEKGNAWKIVLLGVVCYMGYLTKEIFLALFLGVIFFSIGKICLALKKGDRNYAIEETKSI
ncbi:MAG: hypothetical protein IJ875_03240, partial [Solobacterium sp.]|nr:hypothetical protein [Solobacterium sp.]